LAAKILASRGFLLTLTAKDLDLPEEIFKLNTIKAMRGDEAVEELQRKSGAVKHLTPKEVAELDPFHKRAELLRGQAEALLGDESGGKDQFLSTLNNRMEKIYGKEKKDSTTKISVSYNHPDGKKETIALDLEAKLQEFISFYQKTKIDLPPDFEDTIRDLWERSQIEIEQAIEENGFDEMLIIPGNIPLTDLKEKMTMENGYYESENFISGGGFAGVVSQNTDKTRLILVHKTQNLKDRPELEKTLNIKGQDIKLDQTLTLEDYIIFQRKYFEETGKHLDEVGWTWLATKAGARLVCSGWNPVLHRLHVVANVFDGQDGSLGVRPSRCFF